MNRRDTFKLGEVVWCELCGRWDEIKAIHYDKKCATMFYGFGPENPAIEGQGHCAEELSRTKPSKTGGNNE